MNVAAGASATLSPTLSTNVTSFTMGALAFGTDSTLNVVPAGSLADTAYTQNFGATTLAGTNTINVANNGTGVGAVSLGAVSGATGNLVKTGSGILVLSAGATYGGTTTVSNGQLRVTGSAAPVGAVTVQNGANLLVTGTLLASPHILDYDLIVLAVAIAYLAARGLRAGFRPFEITLLGALWIVPLLARSAAGVLALPIGFFVIATFYVTTLTYIRREAASHGQPDFAKT